MIVFTNAPEIAFVSIHGNFVHVTTNWNNKIPIQKLDFKNTLKSMGSLTTQSSKTSKLQSNFRSCRSWECVAIVDSTDNATFLLTHLESANSYILTVQTVFKRWWGKIWILCKLGFLMQVLSLAAVGDINQANLVGGRALHWALCGALCRGLHGGLCEGLCGSLWWGLCEAPHRSLPIGTIGKNPHRPT